MTITATIKFDQSNATSDEMAAIATIDDILHAVQDGRKILIEVESPDGGTNFFDVGWTADANVGFKGFTADRIGTNRGGRA